MATRYHKDPQAIVRLNETQFNVTQKNATEWPFSGEYCEHFEERLYVDNSI